MTAALSSIDPEAFAPAESSSARLQTLLLQLGTQLGTQLGARVAPRVDPKVRALPLGWPAIDALLPDGGLPRGVIELSSPRALGGATSVALAAVRAAHQRDARAWCAWLDPEGTLYAPGIAMAGADLKRLLVVRPPREELGRTAVRVAAACACDVVVIDMAPIPGAGRALGAGSHGGASHGAGEGGRRPSKRRGRGPVRDDVLVRKLALVAEEGGATVLLLTDALGPRAVPWPVALRLELARAPGALSLRVAKDRRGRVALAKTRIPWASRPQLSLEGTTVTG